MLAKVRDLVMPSLTRQGPIEASDHRRYVVSQERAAFSRVRRQYCGQLGKQANCQVAVTLSIANHHGSLPIAYRLYLPRAWTGDRSRRAEAHVPSSIRFKTKPQLALEQIRAAVTAKVARGAVLMDAGYGTNSGLRRAITGLGLGYVAAIISTVKVRALREDNRKLEARQRRSLGAQPAQERLAHHHVARRQQRETAITLCLRTRACRPDTGRSAVCRRDTADRMAQG